MSGRGLNTTLHVGLTNPRLLKRNSRNDNNPYLSDNRSTSNKKQKILGPFHQKGDITGPLQLERDALDAIQLKIKRGELPDPGRGEDKWFVDEDSIPKVEWWDAKYYLLEQEDQEEKSGDEDDEDDEERYRPSIEYVLHPAPPKLEDKTVNAKLYLTTKERRQLRKNKRLLQQREVQKQVHLGLIPKPENKVKLSTMMNQQGQGIDMPTGWEQKVKDAMSERKRQHDLTNQRRHEMAQQKDKIVTKVDSQSDILVQVYRFKQLINPSIRFKLMTNARQLEMKGCCLRDGDDGPGILILLTSKEKSMKFMNRLILSRLPWKESFTLKNSDRPIDMSENSIEMTWSGQVSTEEYARFPRRWFMKVCNSSNDIKSVLNQFQAEHYYKV